MNNFAIKIISMEHGREVITYLEQFCKNDNRYCGDSVGNYYGIINNKLRFFSFSSAKELGMEIIELPTEKIVEQKEVLQKTNESFKKRRLLLG